MSMALTRQCCYNYSRLYTSTSFNPVFLRLFSESNGKKDDQTIRGRSNRLNRLRRKILKNSGSSEVGGDADKGLVLAVLPTRVPIVAVPFPIFPNFDHYISVTHPALSKAINENYKNGEYLLGCFAERMESSSHIKNLNQIYHFGTLAKIKTIQFLSPDSTRLVVTGTQRIRLSNEMLNQHSTELHYKPLDLYQEETIDGVNEVSTEKSTDDNLPTESDIIFGSVVENKTLYNTDDYDLCQAMSMEITATLEEILGLTSPTFRLTVGSGEHGMFTLDDFIKIADAGVAFIKYRPKYLQDVIQESDIRARLEISLNILKQELEINKIHQNVVKKAHENIARIGRRTYLLEQLKVIKNELGDDSDSKRLIFKKSPNEKYRDRISKMTIPAYVTEVLNDELEKLNSMDPHSAEYSTVNNYVDLLTSLPWGAYSTDNSDLNKARSILDADHYGISDVKDAIIEFMAVANQSSSSKGKILCFCGPPGVGKTSVVKSIARALDREYVRVSLGGMDDVCEIKGHRRTYIGSLPGKIIQSLKRSKTMNPVILLDEVDKLSRNSRGDPSSALLEALDPEQNCNFIDHYLDIHIDLSKVLFICTANTLKTISTPLLDRMEVIKISSYINEEKHHIATNFIIPSIVTEFGVKEDTISVSDTALNELISEYSREPGMRSLKKNLEKVYRKAAVMLQTGTEPPISVEKENLKKFVGVPQFYNDKIFDKTPAGVVAGLAYTELGGKVLYIETVPLPSGNIQDPEKKAYRGGIELTGHLGKVMKESCTIAHCAAVLFLKSLDPKNNYLIENRVHCHFPDGAVPKDGPSAGVGIVTSLISLALDIPVRSDLAMTGEICLNKLVLPVGGLKEKLIAAIRTNVTDVIVPFQNKPDIEDLQESITSKLNVHYATSYEDVFKIAFPTYVVPCNNTLSKDVAHM